LAATFAFLILRTNFEASIFTEVKGFLLPLPMTFHPKGVNKCKCGKVAHTKFEIITIIKTVYVESRSQE